MESHSDFCSMFSVVISEIKPFNVPIKNRHRVGGVKTPPYEGQVLDLTTYYGGTIHPTFKQQFVVQLIKTDMHNTQFPRRASKYFVLFIDKHTKLLYILS